MKPKRNRYGRRLGTPWLERRLRRSIPAYVLLETVIATGMLLVGMSVIGAQLQQADAAVRKMDVKLRAIMLAEMQLAEMDLGLIELDSVDAVQEEDFGPRFKDWGWRLTIDKTAIDKMFLMRADVLYAPREDYDEGDFDFENAELVYTLFALRATPQPLDLTTEFGLTDEQSLDLTDKLSSIGGGFDPANFDPAVLAKLPFEELIEVLPPLLQAFGIPLSEIKSMLPPNVREQLDKLGLLEEGEKDSVGEQGENGQPNQEGKGEVNPEGEGEVQE